MNVKAMREIRAAPAPVVGPATAEDVIKVEPALARGATPEAPPKPEPAKAVGPAVPFDNPIQFAPDNTTGAAATPRVDPAKITAASLRQNGGTDFEGYAAVLERAPEKNFVQKILPCIFDERNFVTYGEAMKYVVIKGSTCFVFLDESGIQILYTCSLDDVCVVQEDRNKPHKYSYTVSPVPGTNKSKETMITVLFKSKIKKSFQKNIDHKQAHQFTFDTSKDPSIFKRFMDAVEKSSAKGLSPVTATSVCRVTAEGKAVTKT